MSLRCCCFSLFLATAVLTVDHDGLDNISTTSFMARNLWPTSIGLDVIFDDSVTDCVRKYFRNKWKTKRKKKMEIIWSRHTVSLLSVFRDSMMMAFFNYKIHTSKSFKPCTFWYKTEVMNATIIMTAIICKSRLIRRNIVNEPTALALITSLCKHFIWSTDNTTPLNC